jgi:mono/diheme cytochrome c family protein
MRRPALLGLCAALAGAALIARATPPTGTAPAPQATASASDSGKQLFTRGTAPSCATCHALQDAGATGNIGPDLDALRPDAARVRNAVQKGFENMPAFDHVLSPAQIDTLAKYVERAAGAAR